MKPGETKSRDNDPLAVGRLILRHRQERGWSLSELTRRCGIDESSLSRIEQGLTDEPRPQTLQRIASAMGTAVEDYFALAGYSTAHGLPALAPYLRAKYDASPETAREVEDYFAWLRTRDNNHPSPNRRDTT